MLYFEDSYFEKETRFGFEIEEMMKRAWASEQEVAKLVIDVCDKYGITYFADYGTMLGTVRHNGFISWDDDIDIALIRPDYEKLMRILPNELPDTFRCLGGTRDMSVSRPLGAVMNSFTVRHDKDFLEEFHGCPYICGIDVYCLDYVPRDLELRNSWRYLYNSFYDAAHRFEEFSKEEDFDFYMGQLEGLAGITFDDNKPLKDQLWFYSEKVAAMFTEDEADDLIWMPDMILSDNYFLRKKEWYSSAKTMKFEKLDMKVPVGYEEFLKKKYGEDYMTPVNARGAHDYPFYKKQMQ